MAKVELIDNINQAAEKNKLLLDQNEKLIRNLTNDAEHFHPQKIKEVEKMLRINRKQLKLELLKIGVPDETVLHIGHGGDPPGRCDQPNPPEDCKEQKRNVTILEIYRNFVSERIKNADQFDDREANELLSKLQTGNNQLKLENLRLSPQDTQGSGGVMDAEE